MVLIAGVVLTLLSVVSANASQLTANGTTVGQPITATLLVVGTNGSAPSAGVVSVVMSFTAPGNTTATQVPATETSAGQFVASVPAAVDGVYSVTASASSNGTGAEPVAIGPVTVTIEAAPFGTFYVDRLVS